MAEGASEVKAFAVTNYLFANNPHLSTMRMQKQSIDLGKNHSKGKSLQSVTPFVMSK